MSKHTMRIHKEGYKMIPVMAIFTGLMYILLYWWIPIFIVQIILAVVGMVFFILVVLFFRDPEVATPGRDGIAYAPADGKVVAIEKMYEGERLKEDRIRVSIFMSPLNVHVNRSPIKGKVSYFHYHPGKYWVAWHPKSSAHNERTTVGLKTESGVEILMRQIAGAVARRIVFYPKVGDEVNQGSSIGFIRFGSRVDLFLPLNAEIKVKISDWTKGGATEVAILK